MEDIQGFARHILNIIHICYSLMGIVFIIVGIAIDKIVIFLPIGIGLIVVDLLVIQHSLTSRNNDKEKHLYHRSKNG